ncbi:hypothetical protein ABZ707_27590 [Streptomyces sp. NPDC006923]|uniref:hypothetical protein n=1 Tax=Streptomyces sp. NPDC006923 TaxID=3155355 RepID=UPI00340B0A46
MRAIRVASAALLGVAALATTAPDSAATVNASTTPFGYTVSPTTVMAGGKVTLAVTKCSTPAIATSGVFDTVIIPSGRTAAATVDWDAKPGAKYQVTFTCNGVSGTTNLSIARTTRAPVATPSTTANGTAVPAPAGTTTAADPAAAVPAVGAATVPPGGVQGGIGGSAGEMNTTEIAAGTALVLMAAVGTVFVVRRRVYGRRH